ncbi:MAG: DUF1622 domain-containing protein [Thermodesulfovibrionales bacterium]|nr:DUF1622 domain-containing protein [Thermodesulfovibrionales bacterium]
MQDIVKLIANYTAIVAEAIAVVFIIIGMLGALVIYMRKTFLFRQEYKAMTESRTHLGHILSVALEFLIAADILKTAISPTWEDLGQLAAIVGIRTVLNYFLSKELKEIEATSRT